MEKEVSLARTPGELSFDRAANLSLRSARAALMAAEVAKFRGFSNTGPCGGQLGAPRTVAGRKDAPRRRRERGLVNIVPVEGADSLWC